MIDKPPIKILIISLDTRGGLTKAIEVIEGYID